MKHLMAFIAKLEQAGVGTQGQNLFLFTMPADVADGVMLRGPIAGDPISSEMPGVIDSEILAVVRAKDPVLANDRMLQISKLMTVYNARISDDVYVTSCEPQTKPIVYPRNASGLLEWAVRFAILFAVNE